MPQSIKPIDWDAVRARYEARDETTTAIAESIGIGQPDLSHYAKKHGWTMRKPQQVKSGSTAETIRRLKESLQQKLRQVEGNAAEPLDTRDTSALLRNFEKVLELEERHRHRKSRKRRESRHLNDTEREELARRIVGLLAGEGREAGQPRLADPPCAPSSQRLAPVGQDRPASA